MLDVMAVGGREGGGCCVWCVCLYAIRVWVNRFGFIGLYALVVVAT